MRKNGSRFISIGQYRLTDLFLFALILVIAELASHYAMVWFPGAALFTFSFMLPITLIVMMRWGWYAIFYAVGSGILYCLLNKGSGSAYLVYGVGNAFVELLLLVFLFVKRETISSKWYHSLWFVVLGWLLVYLGRASVWTITCAVHPIEGVSAGAGFVDFAVTDVLTLVLSVVIIMALRRFEGMFEDQRLYLARTDKARRDKMKKDEFGEEYAEIDEEALNMLSRHDGDLY